MDSWDYKYAPGQYVFTEDSARRNMPPMRILDRTRTGYQVMREDMSDPFSKKIIDPATGRAMRTPYEPGYRVRMERGPEDWSEFSIPEKSIKGVVDEAKGGPIHMQVGGLTALARLGKAGTKLTPAEQAALRARGLGVPGIDFADPLNPKDIMRMSEALGASGSEGKTLNITQADRSRVFGPNKGGTGFSGLQLTSEPHQQAGSVWGVGKPSHATRLINANDPNTVWSTFIGAPTQHMSNPVTVERMYQAHKAASPSSELIGKMNDMLNSAVNPKTGKRVFPDGIDISDPSALSQAKTFDQRKLLAQAMTMGGEKKGEKATQEAFKIIKEETDPLLTDAPTYAVGNRLFTIDQNTGIHRPDLNVAFPHQVTGTDLGLLFEPAPIELAMPEFAARFEGRLNKAGKPQPLGHKDLTATTPRQFVSEEYLTNLQKEGYKEGGNVKSFSQRLAEGLHLAVGGGVTNMSDTRPDITDGGQQIAAPFYAKGGPIKINFKGLRGRKPKRFEDGGPAAVDPFAIPMQSDADIEHTRRVLKEAGKALGEQYEREKKTLSTKEGRQDVAKRIGLQIFGTGPDLLNLAAKGVDVLQEQVPFLREPASVMDEYLSRQPVPIPFLPPKIQYKPKFPLSSDKPYGGSEMWIDRAKERGWFGKNEAPMAELLGNIVGGGALAKAPKAVRQAERGLNAVTAAAQRPFTPATITMEAVAPDLGKFKPRDWQETLTRRLTGEGAPVSMETMGGLRTVKRPGQGVYANEAGQLETNPMVAVDVPTGKSLSSFQPLRQSMVQSGSELGQESVAAHRFLPMLTNNINDATAMLIKSKGRSLTNEEVRQIGAQLEGMVVAHNPRLGGVVVYPFELPKKGVPPQLVQATDVASEILGKNAKITYGRVHPTKEIGRAHV